MNDDLFGFGLRLYLAPDAGAGFFLSPGGDGEGGGGDGGEGSSGGESSSSSRSSGGEREGDSGSDGGGEDVARLSRENATTRRRLREVEGERNELRSELQRMRERQDRLLRAAGLDDDDGGDGGPDPEDRIKAERARTAEAFRDARFSLEAAKANLRTDRIDAAIAIAEREGLFDGVNVDLEGRKVEGLDDVLTELRSGYPELFGSANGDGSPDESVSGRSSGFSVDLDNVTPEDIRRLARENREEFDRLVEDLVIHTGQSDRRTGAPISFRIQRGGSELKRQIVSGWERARAARAKRRGNR